jgi:Spy/CpxP family protein refolding chaperone
MRSDEQGIRMRTRIPAWVPAVAGVTALGWWLRRAVRRSAVVGVIVLPMVGDVDAAFAQTAVSPRAAMDPCHRGDDIDDFVASTRWTMLQQVRDLLGLTEQQAKDIQAMRQARRDEVRGDAQTLCEARSELQALIATADSDPTAVRAAGEKAKAAQARVFGHRIEGELELRSQLTPEQWARWLDLRRNLVERRRRLGAALDW